MKTILSVFFIFSTAHLFSVVVHVSLKVLLFVCAVNQTETGRMNVKQNKFKAVLWNPTRWASGSETSEKRNHRNQKWTQNRDGTDAAPQENQRGCKAAARMWKWQPDANSTTEQKTRANQFKRETLCKWYRKQNMDPPPPPSCLEQKEQQIRPPPPKSGSMSDLTLIRSDAEMEDKRWAKLTPVSVNKAAFKCDA